MDFEASKLKNSPPGGRCPPDPLPGRCPCTPPGVNPRTPILVQPPPRQIPVSAYEIWDIIMLKYVKSFCIEILRGKKINIYKRVGGSK